MSKIRINELARQLEVPSHAILDMLPELGVTEKKTHSSSVDEPIAELVRQRVQGGQPAQAHAESRGSAVAVEELEEQVAPYTSFETEQPGRGHQEPGFGAFRSAGSRRLERIIFHPPSRRKLPE